MIVDLEKQHIVMKELDRITITETAAASRPIVLAYILGYAVGGLLALVGVDGVREIFEQSIRDYKPQ